jgi:hypothetical protein
MERRRQEEQERNEANLIDLSSEDLLGSIDNNGQDNSLNEMEMEMELAQAMLSLRDGLN